jgi:lysophospholipase L1-like esterase
MKKIAFLILAVIALTASHPWQNKRVAYLGDSITDPRSLPEDPHYWSYLQEMLNTETYVYGISGRQWKHVLDQANKLKTEHGDEVDAIMIFMGTNDYNSGTPIGEWFTETTEVVNANGKMVERKRRDHVFDNSTFRGRLNIALDSLKKMYPTKQIVMLTPIHRGFAQFSEKNVQPSEEYCNGCGEYIDAYVNSIKEASAIWSVPVIDLYSLSGLLPALPEQSMYVPGGNDNLHPNAEGHRRMALCIYYQLQALPCTFTEVVK